MFSYSTLSPTQCEQFTQFATFLRLENQSYNLTRITDTEQIYVRHFADSLEPLSKLDRHLGTCPAPRVLDIGSGAGLPGLALAIARPSWQIVSMEATQKKVHFQKKAATLLRLTNVEPVHGRAEDLAHDPGYRQQFDTVLARAVAQLRILAEITAGFIKPGGHMIALKGPNIEQELKEAESTLKCLNLALSEVIPYTLSDLSLKANLTLTEDDATLNLVVLTKNGATPSCYPRAYGVIKKGPPTTNPH
jgi:16S rRNA (guanine527-N7)-methyltransferase